MQTSAPCHRLLQNVTEVIVSHRSEGIKIKFLGIFNAKNDDYLYAIGDPTDCPECATEDEVFHLMRDLPTQLRGYNGEELSLEVISCYEDLEELASEYIPSSHMESVLSILHRANTGEERASA